SQPVMNYSDPPEHTRRRSVVSASFGPKRMAALLANAPRLINDLLDQAAARGGVTDAVAEICQPVVTEVLLGALMKVAPADRAIFFKAVAGMGPLDQLRPGDPKPQAFLDGWADGTAYIRRVTEEARTNKAETLVGILAAASESGKLAD